MKFTGSQIRAIEVSRRSVDACVVAGPGSGKTTVLVEHFRRMVDSGIDPLALLAITFTEKAAASMRKKLAEAFQPDPVLRGKLERAYVSTVHGFCMRLLRENAIFAGLDPEFTVIDERESLRMQQRALSDSLQAGYDQSPDAVTGLLSALDGDPAGAILGAYDAMRCAGMTIAQAASLPPPPRITLEDFAAALGALRQETPRGWSRVQLASLEAFLEAAERIVSARNKFAALADFSCNLNSLKRGDPITQRVRELRDNLAGGLERTLLFEHFRVERAALIDLLQRFDGLYRGRKAETGVLDYSDLEAFTVRLLEDDEAVRDRVRRQFEQVLMDEFQDTNGQQSRLLDLLRPPGRFYAVGDINQSIFGFRHAEPRVFTEYRDAVAGAAGHLVELEENFRSRAPILRCVELATDPARGVLRRRLIAKREFTSEKTIPCVEIFSCLGDDTETALAVEARQVATRILELEGTLPLEKRIATFEDFALLVRNTEVIAAFTEVFDTCGIPYLVSRGKGFYETREIRDLTCLLRVVANPRDEISLASVLRSPLVEVSDEALLRMKQKGSLISGIYYCEDVVGLAPGDRGRLVRVREQLERWRALREYTPFDRLLAAAVDETAYPLPRGERGTANVEKFMAQARDAFGRMSLAEFVEELALVRESDPREPDAPPDDAVNAVRIMTVHSAKGLEFPIVLVAALHKGINRSTDAVVFSPRIGIGVRWNNPANGKGKGDCYECAIRDERNARENEESDRLLYVAMTRAEEHLVLSFANSGNCQNWAAVLEGSLQIDFATPREAVATLASPYGEPFDVRVVVADRASAPRPRDKTRVQEAGEMLEAPTASGQYDGNAAVTSVARFAECPRRCYLERYLGLEAQPLATLPSNGGGLTAGELGTQVHQLLAGELVAGPDPEAERLAAVFRRSPLAARAAAAATAEREFDFLMAMDDVVLRGQIDLWFEEAGELVLVDYKTDDVPAAEAPARAAGEHALQLRLYALALEKYLGRMPDRAVVYFLRPDRAVEIDLSPLALEQARQAVTRFREAQEVLGFPMTIGGHCARCPYHRGLCPAGAANGPGLSR